MDTSYIRHLRPQQFSSLNTVRFNDQKIRENIVTDFLLIFISMFEDLNIFLGYMHQLSILTRKLSHNLRILRAYVLTNLLVLHKKSWSKNS